MKTTAIFFAFCLLLASLSYGQAQTDSLTLGDTISITKQRILFSTLRKYRYHLATGLISSQMLPLLKQTPDEEITRLLKRYRRLATTSRINMGVGYASMVTGLIYTFKHPTVGLPLSVGGMVLFYSAPAFRMERTLEQAVNQHNQRLRSQSGDYYRPLFDLRPARERLSLRDTVVIQSRFLYPKFTYRGVRLDPANNLKLAVKYLNSAQITGNMRYIRGVRGVSGFLGGLSAGALSAYFLLYASRRTLGYYPVNRAFVYPTLTLFGVSLLGSWHANRQQLGTMYEYNQKIKEAATSRME